LSMGNGVPAKCAVHGAVAAAHIPVRCPGLGSLSRSLLGCLRKDVALVSHCVPGLEWGTLRSGPACKSGTVLVQVGDGSCLHPVASFATGVGETVHFMYTVLSLGVVFTNCVQVGDGSCLHSVASFAAGVGETAHFMCTVLSLGVAFAEAVLSFT
jgi:hypothetical protein